ncbi:glycosyltransferase family 39 protein [Plectonema cf. radiosum LEGE 06105]|uniref:Glycosyltransferase family 39 protein n=1 Tax=Plectonema cf. radiosum LEGE 06105 TaxID=945769 RepID=A0A8J7JWS1_9CYAN|nr:glycosyltransferase family 39 protein [Plectonema radiosum]MBE9215935.1 glycosyltransferase family 39 protein [Plectonema cf. radiosum LEGE 06105]
MTQSVSNHLWKNIEKRPALAVMLSILWLMLVTGIAFFWHLGSISLIDETEPLFAEASRQMYVTGDWITPYFNGETRFDKPALIYWCQAVAYMIFGVNEWAVRLPSAIAALAMIALTFYTLYWYQAQTDDLEGVYRTSRRWLTAGLGATVIALNPEIIAWARVGVSDMLLTGCMASALLCFFLGYAQSPTSLVKARWYFAFYVLIGLAILTKGPVGIVLPGLIILLFLVYLGNFWQVVREISLIRGMFVICAVSIPWYLLVTWRNGWNFIDSFFGLHNVERFTEVVNGHSAPWYFYFIVVTVGFAPYSVYLPVAIARLKLWERKSWMATERSQQLGLFACCWFIGVFSFFTIAVTKLPSYVLPLMPAAGILIALLWSNLIVDTDKQPVKTSSPNSSSSLSPVLISSPLIQASGWLNVIFTSALGFTLLRVSGLIGYDPAAPNFPQMLQKSNLPVLAGIIWLAAAVIIAILLIRRRYLHLIVINLLAFTVFMIFVLTPTLFVYDQSRQLPLKQLSQLAVQVQKPGEELIQVGFKKPSVAFYAQRQINYIPSNQEVADYIQNQAKSNSVLMITQPKKIPEIGLKPNEYQTLAKKTAYHLIRVEINPQ